MSVRLHDAPVDRMRFGRAIRALRGRRDWRQADLAERSGLSRSVVGRIELGRSERIAFGDLEAVARALDGQLELAFRWRGESLDRLIDERHAAIVDEVVRIYRDADWDVVVEASFSIYGERGSIDVFGWHRRAELVAVNEIKASVPEAGNTVMGVDRKARLAPEIARDRGWRCRGVARFLVVGDGSTSRDRIARHADIFRTAFPAGTRASLAWIRDPSTPPPSGIIFVSPRNARGTGSARRPGPPIRRPRHPPRTSEG
jgi:transcriptional regulator with XRE-family HTH domain